MNRKIDPNLIILITGDENTGFERFIQSCDNREDADKWARLFAEQGAVIKEFGITIGKYDTETNYALEYTEDAGSFSVWIPEMKTE